MRIRPDFLETDRSRKRRGFPGFGSRSARLGSLALVLGLLASPAAVALQEEQQEALQETLREAEAALEKAAAAVAEEVDEEAERLEEALDDLEERLDDLEEAVDDSEISASSAAAMRDQRRNMRRARERIRSRLRSSPRDAKVSFGSNIHLEAGKVGRDLVAIFGSVHAEGDVNGDVVAIFGSAEVDGRVTGDIVTVGGKVILGPNADVFGEITAVGSVVERADGARVRGGVNEIAVGSGIDMAFFDRDWGDLGDWNPGWSSPSLRWGSLFEFFMGIGWLLIIAMLAALIHLVGRDSLERIGRKAVATPWVSLLVGLLLVVFSGPVVLVLFIILCITIIGIPIAVLLLFGAPLLLFFSAVTGLAAIGLVVGRWAEGRFGWNLGGGLGSMLVGLVILHALSMFGDLVGIGGRPLTFFAVMFGFAGFLVQLAGWMVGLGALVLNMVERRDGAAPVAAALPPVPETPGGGDAVEGVSETPEES